jgi:hypothetical protein
MSKNKTLANIILLVHLTLVFIILFGWYFPKIKYLYLASLATTLLSELFLGYCILTKWEFDIRKKVEPTLNYDYTFLSYYAYKAGIVIDKRIVKYSALAFLLSSLIIFYARTFIYS